MFADRRWNEGSSKGTRVQHSALIYQFLIGGVIFAIGVIVPFRAGDYSLRRPEDRRTAGFMVAGAIAYLVGQSLWHVLAVG